MTDATSLHQAARSQARVQVWIDAVRTGRSLDAPDDAGATPLHHALQAVTGRTILPTPAYALLALGAAPDLPDARGVRPLHIACDGTKADAVWLLLTLGADPRAVDHAGRSPLQHTLDGRWCSDNDRTRTRDLLHGEGGEPPPVDWPDGCRVDWARAALALRGGADIHARDAAGNTPLHLAGSTSIMAALLALGADPNATNDAGETPLHVACRGIGQEIPLLLANGADADRTDRAGKRPIDGLLAQSYERDFHDGDRLEWMRQQHIRRIARSMGA